MAEKYVNLPLFDDYEYSYTIVLQGQSYSVTFYFNERVQLWFMDLINEDATPVFQGIGITPLYPIALDYAIYPLTGYFWLENIPDNNTEQYKEFPDKLRQYYRFYYIFEE